MSSIKQHHPSTPRARVITDTIITGLEAGDVSFRVKIFAKRKTVIKACTSKWVSTNIVLRAPLEKFSIWLESDCIHPGLVLCEEGFVNKNTNSGPLRIRVFNRERTDILVGPEKFHLAYLQCLPYSPQTRACM